MAATLGSLRLDLGLELARFQSDMGKATHIVQQGMKRIEGVARNISQIFSGEVILRGARLLSAQIQKAAEQGTQLVDLSQKTGIAIRELSQLSIVAADSGIKFDSLSSNLIRFNKSIAEAVGGTKEQKEAFRLLGLSQDELRRLSPEQVLERVADEFTRYADGANKARLAQALFGKEGADLIPLLNQGGDSIRAQREEAERLGLTLSDIEARQLKAFQDRLDKTGQVTAAFRNHIAIGLTPALDTLLKQFNDATTNAEKFDRAERSAAAGGRLLASAAIIITHAFSGIGNAIGNVAAALAKFYEGANFVLLLNPVTAAFEQIRLAAKNGADAIKILNEGREDSAQGLSDELSQLAAIWDESAKAAESGSKRIAAAADKATAPNLEGALAIGKDADKAASEAKRAREEIDLMTQRLAAQVEAFGKSDTALLKYRLTQGDLADEMALIGNEADAMRDRLLTLSATYDELVEQQEREQELLQLASSLYEETRTPLESFNDEIERLNELRDTFVDGKPLIDGETYVRGIKLAQDALDEFDEDLKRTRQLAADLNDGFRDVFGNMLDDLREGKASWKSFTDDILDMLFEIGKQQLLASAFGQQGTSGGGWVGALMAAAGSYFNSSGPSGSYAFQDAGVRAIGGPVMPNSLYRVSENGPEMANIGGKSYLMTGSAGGSVTPTGQSGGDMRPITVIQNINTPDVASFKASGSQIAASAFAQAQRAHARQR